MQKICRIISPAHRRTARTAYFLPQRIYPTPFCQWMAGKVEQAVPAEDSTVQTESVRRIRLRQTVLFWLQRIAFSCGPFGGNLL